MPPKKARSGDRGRWEPSSSSEEDWENPDSEWDVIGIEEDHMNTRGDIRFNISWDGWKRDDGSNTTWELQGGTTMQDLTENQRRWQRSRDAEFAREAEHATYPPFSPTPCPEDQLDENIAQREKPQAKQKFKYTFTELAHQTRQMAVHLGNEDKFPGSPSLESAFTRLQNMRSERDSALKALDTDISRAPSLFLYDLGPAPKKPTRYRVNKKAPLHEQMRSLHVSKPPSRKATRPVRSVPPVVPEVNPVPQSQRPTPDKTSFNFSVNQQEQPGIKYPIIQSREARPLPQRFSAKPDVRPGPSDLHESTRRRKIPLASSSAPSPHSYSSGPDIPIKTRTSSPRDILQTKWSTAVRTSGAASVTFVDDFDEASAPVHDIAKFKYLESDYAFSSAVPKSDPNFMESCDCTLACTASLCPCQDDSLLQEDDSDAKAFAYDNKGLYAFRESMESYVIECNKNCQCDAKCQSRVAQRPRRFPIEIFRTERCGWGVRSTVPLPKGSVLGVYTGPHSRSSGYSGKRGTYVFDLDYFKRSEGIKYSVDAYSCGNWTRFINHSCDPVCNIYPVVWDSVPSMHQPKLAFVANTDIPARTELSIDYNPGARKGKGKAKTMPGTPECMCGSHNCRGSIYFR